MDGVRIDAAKHIPPGWLTALSGFIHARKPAYVFGEWFLEAHGCTQDNAAFANGTGMSLLHFMFTHAIREAFMGRRASVLLPKCYVNPPAAISICMTSLFFWIIMI